MSAPPPASAVNWASEPVATTVMSRRHCGPQKALTASAAPSSWPRMRSSRAALRAPPSEISCAVRPSRSVAVVVAGAGAAVLTEVVAVAVAGPAGGAGRPNSRTAQRISASRTASSSRLRLGPADVGIGRHQYRRTLWIGALFTGATRTGVP